MPRHEWDDELFALARVLLWLGVPILLVALLAGCAGQPVALPAQPTPSSLASGLVALAAIDPGDPPAVAGLRVWKAGKYDVDAACDVYLNQQATQAASVNQLSSGIGVLGAGLSVLHPAAGVASSLAQTFLSSYQAAGAMPYTDATSGIIYSGQNAYAAGVARSPPADALDAADYVEGYWALCTPVGYRRLVNQAINTAFVSTAPGALAAAEAAEPAHAGRPIVTVNGH